MMTTPTAAPPTLQIPQPPTRPSYLKRLACFCLGASAIVLSLGTTPALAGDPFRTNDARPIGDRAEQAFKAVFEQGNYPEARRILRDAETDEPLTHALRAALAYAEQDWGAFKAGATQTRLTGEQLAKTDPLRGNLYIAVGHFFEGGYILTQEGTVKGVPEALDKLNLVFSYLNAAEKVNAQDPELNMIKGFMELMLAVNLPFSKADQAINRLDKYAGPRYLAYRGIALGYRDLNQDSKALDYVNQAIALTPDNPDLYYLKGQLMYRQKQYQQSLPFFQKALQKSNQLPSKIAKHLAYENCVAESYAANNPSECLDFLKKLRE